MKKLILSAALAFTAFTLTQPAQAATQRSADFTQGNTVGIGLFGLSYDYGLGPVSLGFDSNSKLNYSLGGYGGSYGGNNLKFSTRGLWKVMETEKIQGAFIAAAHYDPGDIGQNKPSFIPEAGFSMAYRIWDSAFLIRLNTTVGYNSTLTGSLYSPSEDPKEVEASFLQKFGVGPGTSFELAYQPDENSEITIGGGSILGMRLKF